MSGLQVILAVHLHKTCPWIPNFKRVLIRYLTEVPWDFMAGNVVIGSTVYNIPSDAFWYAHVLTAHNGGPGCSVPVHTAYLTEGGRIADFEYGVQLTDLTYRPYDQQDFEIECRWWRENFDKAYKNLLK
jgi:hypothetical protein